MGDGPMTAVAWQGECLKARAFPPALKRPPLPGPVRREGGSKRRVKRLKTGKAKAANRIYPGQAESYW